MTEEATVRRATQGEYLRVLHEVLDELGRATAHNPPMNSLHEGYAVALEEMDEWWEEIKRKPANRNYSRLRHEAIQAAAMVVRTITDCLGVES